MKISFKVLGIFVLSIAFLFGFNPGDSSAQPLGDGMTIYFQMGGDPGGAATLPLNSNLNGNSAGLSTIALGGARPSGLEHRNASIMHAIVPGSEIGIGVVAS